MAKTFFSGAKRKRSKTDFYSDPFAKLKTPVSPELKGRSKPTKFGKFQIIPLLYSVCR